MGRKLLGADESRLPPAIIAKSRVDWWTPRTSLTGAAQGANDDSRPAYAFGSG
jgi:hypothetical protein